MEVEKTIIQGISILDEDGTDCSFYFNDKMLNAKIMIAVDMQYIEVIDVYHENEAFICRMEINKDVSKIARYRVIKDMYKLLDEHEIFEFQNLMHVLCHGLSYVRIKTPEGGLQIRSMINIWTLSSIPGAALKDINVESVYQFIANRNKNVN